MRLYIVSQKKKYGSKLKFNAWFTIYTTVATVFLFSVLLRPNEGTGPNSDVSLGTDEGYYMYIKSSEPQEQGWSFDSFFFIKF